VRFETDSLWAADGSVSKSRLSESGGAAFEGEFNDDDETEDLMVMKDSFFEPSRAPLQRSPPAMRSRVKQAKHEPFEA